MLGPFRFADMFMFVFFMFTQSLLKHKFTLLHFVKVLESGFDMQTAVCITDIRFGEVLVRMSFYSAFQRR